MSYKGKFKPKNPQKYVGDVNKIIYRSSWERHFMNYVDLNENVTAWASEEIFIPYISPLDNEFHRYFPDFWMKVKNSDGVEETLVVEIKPAKENAMNEDGTAKPLPPRGKKLMRYYLKEVARWGVNDAKFQAAKVYCEERGWTFRVLTEKELNIPTAANGPFAGKSKTK
jgi:hypothetical protein